MREVARRTVLGPGWTVRCCQPRNADRLFVRMICVEGTMAVEGFSEGAEAALARTAGDVGKHESMEAGVGRRRQARPAGYGGATRGRRQQTSVFTSWHRRERDCSRERGRDSYVFQTGASLGGAQRQRREVMETRLAEKRYGGFSTTVRFPLTAASSCRCLRVSTIIAKTGDAANKFQASVSRK